MSKLAAYIVLLCCGAQMNLSMGDPLSARCEAVEGAPTCVCKMPSGVIDLTKIASYEGTPRYVLAMTCGLHCIKVQSICFLYNRFTGIRDSLNYSYDYNPCVPFSTTFCSNVHVSLYKGWCYLFFFNAFSLLKGCQRNTSNVEMFSIADYGTEQMRTDENGNVFLHYVGHTSDSEKPRYTSLFPWFIQLISSHTVEKQ